MKFFLFSLCLFLTACANKNEIKLNQNELSQIIQCLIAQDDQVEKVNCVERITDPKFAEKNK